MDDTNKDELIEEKLQRISSDFELDVLRLIKTQSMLSLSKQVIDGEFRSVKSKSDLIQNKLNELSIRIESLKKMYDEPVGARNLSQGSRSIYFDELSKIIDDYFEGFTNLQNDLNEGSVKASERLDSLHYFYKSELQAYKEQIDSRLEGIRNDFLGKLNDMETASEFAVDTLEARREKSSELFSSNNQETGFVKEKTTQEISDDNFLKFGIAGLILASLMMFSALYMIDFRGVKSLIGSITQTNNSVKHNQDNEQDINQEKKLSKPINKSDERIVNKENALIDVDSDININNNSLNSDLIVKKFPADLKVKINRANFRNGPGKRYNVIGVLTKGEKVLSLNKDKGIWTKIKTRDGVEGWVAEKLLERI